MRISDWSSDVCSSDLSQLWEIYMNRPNGGWLEVRGSGLTRLRDDFLQTELAKGFRSITKPGAIQTNRWGMRDQDYAQTPPPGTLRGVVLGYSTVMGWGVEQGAPFEAGVEARVSQRLAELAAGGFELMNLSVPGRSEEHTSELQSLMRTSYAVFCLKKKKT